MYFLVDRRTNSNWLALQVSADQYLWSEFGAIAGGTQGTVAQLLQNGNLPRVVQNAIQGVVGLAASPRIPQAVLLSPVLQDCNPTDQTALEQQFARDVLGTDVADRPRETTAQEQIAIFLGTVIAERGANIRSGPGLEYGIVTAVPYGHMVAYIAKSEDGAWLHLEDGNWILSVLVATPDQNGLRAPLLTAEPAVPPSTSAPRNTVIPLPPLAAALNSTTEMAALRLQALQHVNHARAAEGLAPVSLGDNAAAQSHAEEMARHQYPSHWNLAGLTPDMRYTLAGGEAYSAENVTIKGNLVGSECISYEPAEWLESALDGLMESPGHRRNILRPEHTTLHLGLSMNCRVLTVVQLFEGAYVTFDIPPTLAEGRLVMQGRLHRGAVLPHMGPAEGIRITYWPPPHPLTRGQLFRAASYCAGVPVASILVPLPAFYSYDPNSSTWSHTRCLTPYESDPQSPPPSTHEQANELKQAAKEWEADPEPDTRLAILPDIWHVDQDRFAVQADVTRLLAELGPGVYTILLWGEVQDRPLPLSKYAIFVE